MAHSAHLDWSTICRRAGGRRKYNRVRRLRAELRLLKVVELLREMGFSHGYQTRIAKKLGVSCATICRDIARLRRRVWGGKEAEKRHDAHERMQRRIRTEEKLERDRLASKEAASEGDEAAAARLEPDAPPPTPNTAPVESILVPRRVSSPHSALADVFRPRRSRQGRSMLGCR